MSEPAPAERAAASHAPDPRAQVISRLRAAGCVFAEDEASILLAEARTTTELETMVARRVDGFPLESIVGWAEFAGARIIVDPGVFVPRRRSELLVREAIVLSPLDPVIVELCCGTAAIATVLSKAIGGSQLYAADIDPAAVRNADRNLGPVGGHIYEGDLYDALPKRLQGRVDVLIANAPYVPTAELALMPPEARVHEPRVALDGGADGLDLHVRIAARAEYWLAPGGHLLIETSRRQATRTAELVAQGGLVPRIIHDSKLDATVVIGTAAS
jgi:release factor glutamine methyltransferase